MVLLLLLLILTKSTSDNCEIHVYNNITNTRGRQLYHREMIYQTIACDICTASVIEIWIILVVYTLPIFSCLHGISNILLLMCGDVESNPGPFAYEHFVTNIRNYSDNLKFTLLNARGIRTKYTEFANIVHDLGKNSIVAVTETWLDNDDNLEPWKIGGDRHCVFAQHRNKETSGHNKGGGVMLIIPSHMQPILREDLSTVSTSAFESLWVEFRLPTCKSKALINVAYCPHKRYSSCFFEQMASDISAVYSESKQVYLLGDYNVDYLEDFDQRKMKEFLNNLDLTIINTVAPTRITDQTSTLIDHFICSNEKKAYNYMITDANFFSDHCMCTFVDKTPIPKPKTIPYFTFCRRGYSAQRFCEELSITDWSQMYLAPSAEDMMDAFERIFFTVLTKHAHYTRKFRKINRGNSSRHPGKPWITENLRQEIKKKHDANKELTRTGSLAAKKEYKQQRNKVTRLLKSAHEQYSNSLFSQLVTTQDKWKFINELRGKNRETNNIDRLCNSFGDDVVEDKGISNLLNYTFSCLGEYFGRTRCYVTKSQVGRNLFRYRFITEKECLVELNKLNPNKPLGPSLIPGWALKDSKLCIGKHLTMVFNEFIHESKFPRSFKLAEVIPIHKKGSATDPSNYRPIAITCALSKVFERLLLNQTNDYLHKHNIMCPTQFGFRKGYSTHDALLYAVETWRFEIDNKRNVHVAFLDLSKAFNSLNHKIFEKKLNDLGFDESSRQLLTDFITARPQRVKANSTYSDWINIHRGVPQGTVLGPLLFSLYMNDITLCVQPQCKIVQFADDTLIFTSSCDSAKAKMDLQINLKLVSEYLEEHELTMNSSKTDYLVIGQHQNSNNLLTVNDNEIKCSPSVKYLGVIIDTKLKLEEQVNSILRKMASGIRTIHIIAGRVPLAARLKLIETLVISHLKYSAPLLTNISQHSINRLERQLNWGIRTCHRSMKFDHITPLRLSSKILGVRYQIAYPIVSKLWCIVNKKSHAFNNFQLQTLAHTVNERTQTLIPIYPNHTSTMLNSYGKRGIKLWNDLPLFMRKIKCKHKFKVALKDHYWNHFLSMPRDRIVTNWNDNCLF